MPKVLVAAVVVAVISGGGLWAQHVELVQAIASFGRTASQADMAATDAEAGPSLSIHIDPHWQKTRLGQCNSRMAHYRAMGLWLHGDATPVVDRAKWEGLSMREKSEIFDIAACIGAAGQVLAMQVSVLDSDGGKVIEARRVMSVNDFTQGAGVIFGTGATFARISDRTGQALSPRPGIRRN